MSPQPPERRPYVLYVDDEHPNRLVFEANFGKRFPLLTCGSGAEALALLEAKAGEIGVLVSDQRMPGMTGSELLARAREVAPEVQRMIVTAYSDLTAVFEAVNRGQVQRYVVKPWDRADLEQHLESALGFYELQARLRTTQERLLVSERLAVLGQVSASVAHELMNPIGSLLTNTQQLAKDVPVVTALATTAPRPWPKAAEPALAEMQDLVKDQLQAIEHLRVLARGVRGQARGTEGSEVCDLAEAAQLSARLTRTEVARHATLQVKGPRLLVRAGQVQLTQILINLVVNAAQAIGESGRRGRVLVTWALEGREAVVKVQDDGVGVPPELLQKIFEPLFTTRPPGVGTGLGLAICSELVERFGGKLSVESTVGSGTTFSFTLPVAPE